MGQTRRSATRAAAGLAGAVLASGARAPAVVGAASTITVAYDVRGLVCWSPLWAARQQGYFRDEGLDVALVGSPDLITPLAQGAAVASLNAAWGLVPPLLPAGVQVGDVVATAGLQRGCSSIVVAPDSPLQTPADLRGQRVASGVNWRMMFSPALNAAGLDPRADVEWQPALPPGQIAEALRTGQVAGAQVIEPFTSALEAAGAARVLFTNTTPPLEDDYCCAALLPSALVRTDRAQAAAITRALMRGAAWAQAHPAEAALLEPAITQANASAADNLRAMAMLDFRPSVAAARQNTLDTLREFVRFGYLDPSTDPTALLARIFVPVTGELAGLRLPATGRPAAGAAALP